MVRHAFYPTLCAKSQQPCFSATLLFAIALTATAVATVVTPAAATAATSAATSAATLGQETCGESRNTGSPGELPSPQHQDDASRVKLVAVGSLDQAETAARAAAAETAHAAASGCAASVVQQLVIGDKVFYVMETPRKGCAEATAAHMLAHRNGLFEAVEVDALVVADTLDRSAQGPQVPYEDWLGVPAAALRDSRCRGQQEAQPVGTQATACAVQQAPPWNLDRIDSRQPPLDGVYAVAADGAQSVTVYVLDTGVNAAHQQFFPNRVSFGANFIDTINTDCNGHGTHVAGVVAASVFGVAKKSRIVDVKVLDCFGRGSIVSVLNGLQYAVNAARAAAPNRTVVNLSLGGGFSAALNAAVAAAVSAGLPVVVSAGNSGTNACWASPASEPRAITVGASMIISAGGSLFDLRAPFSNYGTCVDLLAPGVNILSAWVGPFNNEVAVLSGTSQAAPHVAGAVALYLSRFPTASPEDAAAWLSAVSTRNALNLLCAPGDLVCLGTPNQLLFTFCF